MKVLTVEFSACFVGTHSPCSETAFTTWEGAAAVPDFSRQAGQRCSFDLLGGEPLLAPAGIRRGTGGLVGVYVDLVAVTGDAVGELEERGAHVGCLCARGGRFDLGELPEAAAAQVGRPLEQQEPAFAWNEGDLESAGLDANPRGSRGQEMGATGAVGEAGAAPGARRAAGFGGGADDRAEFHEGLVEVGAVETAWMGGDGGCELDEGEGVRFESGSGWRGLRVAGDAEGPGEHSEDVAVDGWRRVVEGDAADGAGGVGADAGQGEELDWIGRDAAVEAAEDFGGGAVKVAGAGVIAEAFPELEHLVGLCARQGANGGESLHPAYPIRDDGLDSGLLEHDLRDPDGVGVPGFAPGEIARVGAEPGQERLCQLPVDWIVRCRAGWIGRGLAWDWAGAAHGCAR